jgi:DNA-binding transcriptional MerR regulator
MSYTPRETVAKTGFSLDTLRYYERIGLLDGVDRTAGGQRVFTDDDLAWLGTLRCLRDTGMPIQRMLRYAELARGGDETFEERASLLEEHDRELEARIAALREEQARIRAKIEWYRA